MFNYSNYGYALAGHVVAEVSGMSFPEYMHSNVLHPLGMHRSSFAPAPRTRDELAVGYDYADGHYQPVPYQHINLVPAAGLHTTATDMARFMIAQLQLGRYGDTRILQEDTVQNMHRRHFANDPRLPGFTYAFFEEYHGDRRVLKHEGAWRGFTSQVLLLSEQDTGLFVAYNRLTTQPLRNLNSQFLGYYTPTPEQPALAQAATDLQREFSRFAGTYRTVRYPRHSLYKLWSAFNGVAPELRIMADQTGAFERIAWYETTTFHLGVAGVFVAIFASTCGVWLYDQYRSTGSEGKPHPSGLISLAQPLSGLVGALNLIFLFYWNLLGFRF